MSAGDLPTIPGGGPVILADPPWTYRVFTDAGKGRSAEQHYDCMSLDDICGLPVADVAAKNCHLFLWCTGPGLVAGQPQQVCRAWGFAPSAMAFVWVKSKRDAERQAKVCGIDHRLFAMGMGHTTRQNAEFVLLGRRGSPRRRSRSVHQIVVAPRQEHSRKPDEVYGRIETYADGPYLELFARQAWPDWTAWGDQVGRFEAAA